MPMRESLTLIMLMICAQEGSMLIFLANLIPLLQCILFSVFNVGLSKHSSASNNVLSLYEMCVNQLICVYI